jgi:hypothetical protein
MFEKKNIPKYLLLLGIILIASYIGKKYTNYLENGDLQNDHKLIQQYLLNESPLYGQNKPKLWIHTKYELNARKWKSFQSRSSTDLNQPYIQLTIKSIVLHCGESFNVCLIDDDSFSKLIPSWSINMQEIAEPKKTQYREYGLAQLLYHYGGLIVPNTFVCRRNLNQMYVEGTQHNLPFICENTNRFANSTAGTSSYNSAIGGTPEYISGVSGLLENAKHNLELQRNNTTLKQERQRLLYTPYTGFMGAKKNDGCILEMVEYLKIRLTNPHFSSENEFLGDYSQWCLTKIIEGKMNIIDGEMIGIKTVADKKPILIENLLEEDFLDIHPTSYGVYIPEDEILRRTKYQWFAVMTGEEILKSRMIISKYLMESMVNFVEPNTKFQPIENIIPISNDSGIVVKNDNKNVFTI